MDIAQLGVGVLDSFFGGGGGSTVNTDGGASLKLSNIDSPHTEKFQIFGDFSVGRGKPDNSLLPASGEINWQVVAPVVGISLLAFALLYRK